MTTTVVVDASVAVKWLVEEDYSRQADELLAAWDSENARIAGPHLLPVEVSNALYQRVRRRQISWSVIAVFWRTQVTVRSLPRWFSR